MHLCMCYHGSTHIHMVYIFILSLSVQPFFGLVGKAAYLPISLNPPSWASGIYPLLFFWQGVSPTPWTFRKNLKTSLCYWGLPFQLFLYDTFQRRRRCRLIFSHSSCAILIVCPVQSPQGYLLFFRVVWSSIRSFGGAPMGSFLSTWSESPLCGSILRKRLQNFRSECFDSTRDVLRKSSPCLLLLRIMTEKV